MIDNGIIDQDTTDQGGRGFGPSGPEATGPGLSGPGAAVERDVTDLSEGSPADPGRAGRAATGPGTAGVTGYGKRDVLGVLVDAVTMAQAVEGVAGQARRRQPCAVTALAVHGIVEAGHDARLQSALNNFDVVLPDGQPVRWALNLLYHLDLPDKVPGPSLVEELLARAADEGWAVHFHGSKPETLDGIRAELHRRFGSALQVTTEPSRFKQVNQEELGELVSAINATGAQLCFVGLGCPRQERFVAAAAPQLHMPALAVGAAFDYLAGNINRAPHVLQRAGLEWLYRTAQEPRRLARRYLVTNTAFTAGVARQWSRQRSGRLPSVVPDGTPASWDLVDA